MVLPDLGDVKFSEDWPDGSSDFQISIIPFETDIQLGATKLLFDESKLVEIHIYVRALSEDEPDEVGDIQKELERILTENPRALIGSGISLIQPLSFRQIFDSDNTKTMWHYCYDVQMYYRKFVNIEEG